MTIDINSITPEFPNIRPVDSGNPACVSPVITEGKINFSPR